MVKDSAICGIVAEGVSSKRWINPVGVKSILSALSALSAPLSALLVRQLNYWI